MLQRFLLHMHAALVQCSAGGLCHGAAAAHSCAGRTALSPPPTTAHKPAGMVHAVRIKGGKAIAYCNRWVDTKRLRQELEAGFPQFIKESCRSSTGSRAGGVGMGGGPGWVHWVAAMPFCFGCAKLYAKAD